MLADQEMSVVFFPCVISQHPVCCFDLVIKGFWSQMENLGHLKNFGDLKTECLMSVGGDSKALVLMSDLAHMWNGNVATLAKVSF